MKTWLRKREYEIEPPDGVIKFSRVWNLETESLRVEWEASSFLKGTCLWMEGAVQ